MKSMRNEFIYKDTGEDLYEKLLGKRITVQRRMSKLSEMRDKDAGINEKSDEKSRLKVSSRL
jgi:hypothetical protein